MIWFFRRSGRSLSSPSVVRGGRFKTTRYCTRFGRARSGGWTRLTSRHRIGSSIGYSASPP